MQLVKALMINSSAIFMESSFALNRIDFATDEYLIEE